MTIASRIATTTAIGTSLLRPIARLDAPSAVTKRISSVAYAVDDKASDEKTASAIVFGSRCSSMLVVASGRPTTTRLSSFSNRVPSQPAPSGAKHATGMQWRVAGASSVQQNNVAYASRSRHEEIADVRSRQRPRGVGDAGKVGGRRVRERAPELVRERNRDDALVDCDRCVGIADEHEPRDLASALDDGELHAEFGNRESAREPSVFVSLDRARAFESRHRPLERRELEPTVGEREERDEFPADRGHGRHERRP